ncbi:cytochrome c oxidase subunit 3 [Lyngbya aestuarii]|uniref:cytochrome c oxidase subunit 3 n=1 Tax=Lyngbya aestuarii TaxID=118322 RepID=UPI00403D81FD
MRNFIPSRELNQSRLEEGSDRKHHDEQAKTMFGVMTFLISESLIFGSFIAAYVALRLFSGSVLPPGVKGPELSTSVIIHSIVLLSSSLPAQLAEGALKGKKLNQFRLLWVITSVMGAYFLVGEVKEWRGLDFDVTTGQFGGAFYILTGFHALHVTVGILLQMLMLVRSFIPGNYNKGHTGVNAITLFWHVVDGIWVILFSLFYLW